MHAYMHTCICLATKRCLLLTRPRGRGPPLRQGAHHCSARSLAWLLARTRRYLTCSKYSQYYDACICAYTHAHMHSYTHARARTCPHALSQSRTKTSYTFFKPLNTTVLAPAIDAVMSKHRKCNHYAGLMRTKVYYYSKTY